MSKWIKIQDKLPKHKQLVLAFNVSGTAVVVIFLDNEETAKFLEEKGIHIEKKRGYQFCSQEIPGNILEGVSHWMPIFTPYRIQKKGVYKN